MAPFTFARPPPSPSRSRKMAVLGQSTNIVSQHDHHSSPPVKVERTVSMQSVNVDMSLLSEDGSDPIASDPLQPDEQDDQDDETGRDLPDLHVEVRLKSASKIRVDLIRRLVHSHLESEYETLLTHSNVSDWQDVAALSANIDRIWIGECSDADSSPAVPLSEVNPVIHVYQPTTRGDAVSEFSTSSPADEDEQDGDVPAASVLALPASSLDGLWDSLIYEDDVKQRLLSYIHSTMLFSDASIDFNIVTWNRVVLLHGPPGTGKTSLCRALAQKLAIRLSHRYESGKLVEINSHSLFSKWFSESGKLVQRLFQNINELVDDEGCFVVVLIDEVESLTAARAGAMSGKEPSDALRVVNALLTQLDKLKHRKNCLVMTTSNLSAAIDCAFIDRADIKQFIGLPPARAVYWILQSCMNELMRVNMIRRSQVTLPDWPMVEAFRASGSEGNRAERCGSRLYDLAVLCKGLSGRTLRRLPVLAHAKHIGGNGATLEHWIEGMIKTVKEEGDQLALVNE